MKARAREREEERKSERNEERRRGSEEEKRIVFAICILCIKFTSFRPFFL